MGEIRVSDKNGIFVQVGDVSFSLDPSRPTGADYTFVSHAHLDHVHTPRGSARLLASRETAALAAARGYGLDGASEEIPGVQLLDSGHILGARAISIGDDVLYTGDAAGRDRAFLGKCRTRKAKVLIMETTYGTRDYTFPSFEELVRDINSLIGGAFDKGKPVVLMGYPLGKAQVLAYLFSSWEPFLVHEKVARMNDVHRQFGVDLKRGLEVDGSTGSIPDGPWVMIAPVMSRNNGFLKRLKKDYDAVSVMFTGWARSGGSAVGSDYAFPLSDHCDYGELLKLVDDVSPETVYTTHGFAAEFARDLRARGYDAKPIGGDQGRLSDYE